jgi:hypothetical protein
MTNIKIICAVLLASVLVLGYKVIDLQGQYSRLERNVVIAVLSAEIANHKIGAIAPVFSQDREKFIRQWIRGENIPLAVFNTTTLSEVRREIDDGANSKAFQDMYTQMMGANQPR